MRIKTIAILLVTILLTVALMQNTERINFNFLWASFPMSELLMLFLVTAIGFILGVLVGRPKKVKRLSGVSDEEIKENKKTDTLSDEDKNYLS